MTNGPLHDALHGAASRYEAAYAAEEAAPARGLAAQARRRRRTTLVATATASLAILGGVGVFVIPAATSGEAELTSADLLPTVDIPLAEYADLDSYANRTDAVPLIVSPDIATCGGPAPGVVLSDEGFSWEVATTGPFTVNSGVKDFGLRNDFASFSGRLTYSGRDTLPVTVDVVAFVLVADGKVVGFSSDLPNVRSARGFEEMRDGHSVATGGSLWEGGAICTPGGRTEGEFPPGHYQAYPVLHIVATKQTAAVAWLGQRGALPPGVFGDGVFEPGSWDCEIWRDDITLAQCDPTSYRVAVDLDSRTASVPYDSSVYVRDVDVTLVGEPVALTVRPPVAGADLDLNRPVILGPEDLQCGVVYTWDGAPESWEDGGVQGTVRDVNSRTVADGSWSMEFLPQDGHRNGFVTYPERMPVWFVGSSESPTNDAPDPNAESGPVVVGMGYALVNGGEPVTLSRYDGPTTTTVDITGVTSCGPSDVEAIVMWFSGTEELSDTDVDVTTTIDRFGEWFLSRAVRESAD